MPVEEGLLAILRCPLTREPLRALAPEELARLNVGVLRGALRHLDGTPADAPLADRLSILVRDTVTPLRLSRRSSEPQSPVAAAQSIGGQAMEKRTHRNVATDDTAPAGKRSSSPMPPSRGDAGPG